jgi:hypothetical protein
MVWIMVPRHDSIEKYGIFNSWRLVRGFLSLIEPLEEVLGLHPAPLLLFSFWTESEGFLCCTAAMMFCFSTALRARGQPTEAPNCQAK